MLHFATDRYEEALPHAERAIRMAIDRYGLDHVETARAMNDGANILLELDRFEVRVYT